MTGSAVAENAGAEPAAGAMLDGIAGRAADADRGESDLGPDIGALRRAGWLAAALPACAGGHGIALEAGTVAATADRLRALGRANLSVGRLYEGHLNAVKLIGVHGSSAQRAGWFDRVRRGALLGVWGADGDPPVALALDASGRARLSGRKRFASGLGLVELAVVTARVDGGTQLLVLPVAEPGRMDPSTWRTSGMRATASGDYSFDGMMIDSDARLGGPDDLYREPWFEGGIWRYAALHTGGMEALAEAVRRHVLARGEARVAEQAGRVAELARLCGTGRLWVEHAGRRVEATGAGPEEVVHALLAREAVERTCVEAMAITDRALGAASFLEGHPVERIRRDFGFFLRQAALDRKRAMAAGAVLANERPIGGQW